MQYTERILDELRAVGINPRGMSSGVPWGDDEAPGMTYKSSTNPIIVAVLASHIPDEAAYLATDLTASAVALQSALGDDVDKWEAYLGVQTSLIREKRYAAYMARGGVNDVYHEVKSDGGTDAAAKQAAVAAKTAVKAKFPWPGTYR